MSELTDEEIEAQETYWEREEREALAVFAGILYASAFTIIAAVIAVVIWRLS